MEAELRENSRKVVVLGMGDHTYIYFNIFLKIKKKIQHSPYFSRIIERSNSSLNIPTHPTLASDNQSQISTDHYLQHLSDTLTPYFFLSSSNQRWNNKDC